MLKNDGSNFQTWKHRTQLVLMSRGLMPIVEGTEKQPEAKDAEALKDWKTRELDARVQIQLTLEEEQLSGVMSAKDTKETWDRILKRLQGEGKHSIALLIGELFRSTLLDENPLEPQLNAMLQLGYNLHSLGQQLDDSLIAIAMIISLPDSFSTLRSILMATDLKLTTESVKSSILQEELLHKGPTTSTALAARFQKKPTKSKKGQNRGKRANENEKGEKDKGGNGKVCRYTPCRFKGHTESECRKLKAVLDKFGHLKDNSSDSKIPSSASLSANLATTSPADYDNTIRLFATRTCPATERNGWMVDSGATQPMCSQRDSFSSYRKLTTPKRVLLNDESVIFALGIGAVELEFDLGKSTREGVIKHVYHVPELHGNLLSVSALTKLRYQLTFSQNGCRILDPNGQLTAVAHLRDDLFMLAATSSTASVRIATLSPPTNSPNFSTKACTARMKMSAVPLAVWH